MAEFAEFDYAYNDEVTCPHCGAEQEDSWERLKYQGDGDEREDTCYECEKPYRCWPTITVLWSTSKVAEEVAPTTVCNVRVSAPTLTIMRPSAWGNPYPLASRNARDVVTCLLAYARHLADSGLIDRVSELRGQTLGCACKPGRCHGDVLARVADAEDARAELNLILDELASELAALPAQGVLL